MSDYPEVQGLFAGYNQQPHVRVPPGVEVSVGSFVTTPRRPGYMGLPSGGHTLQLCEFVSESPKGKIWKARKVARPSGNVVDLSAWTPKATEPEGSREDEVADLTRRLRSAESERDEWRKRVQFLEHDSDGATDKLRKECDGWRESARRNEVRIDELLERIDALTKERDGYQSASITYQQEAAEKSSAVVRLREELTTAEERADKAEQEARESLDEAMAAMDAAEEAVKAARADGREAGEAVAEQRFADEADRTG